MNKRYIESSLGDNLDTSKIQNNILQPIFDLQNNFASNMPLSEYTKYVAVIEAMAEAISNVVATKKDKSKSQKENDTARLKEVIEALEKETTNIFWNKLFYILLDIIEFLMQQKYPIFFKEERKWVKTLEHAKKLDNYLSHSKKPF